MEEKLAAVFSLYEKWGQQNYIGQYCTKYQCSYISHNTLELWVVWISNGVPTFKWGIKYPLAPWEFKGENIKPGGLAVPCVVLMFSTQF